MFEALSYEKRGAIDQAKSDDDEREREREEKK
jgi:hypothetical protein